jgi:hypothetical protein
MFNWFLNFLARRGRKSTIYDRDDKIPYLDRYYLAWADGTQRQRKNIPFNVFLHRFLISDEPVWHDHPWNFFISIVIAGSYMEHTPWGDKYRRRWNMRFVNCNKMRHINDDPTKPLIPANIHWVEVPENGKTWTLFIRGRTNKSWGFYPDMTTGKQISWRDYLPPNYKHNENNTPSAME